MDSLFLAFFFYNASYAVILYIHCKVKERLLTNLLLQMVNTLALLLPLEERRRSRYAVEALKTDLDLYDSDLFVQGLLKVHVTITMTFLKNFNKRLKLSVRLTGQFICNKFCSHIIHIQVSPTVFEPMTSAMSMQAQRSPINFKQKIKILKQFSG